MEIYYTISSENMCNISSIPYLSRIYMLLFLRPTDIGEKAASKTRVSPVAGLKQSLQKSFWSYLYFCPNQQKTLWDKRGKQFFIFFFDYSWHTILY